MANDEIAALEAQLAGLSGEARTQPLLQLGQLCSDLYWRTGPGTAAALPYLDKAVRAFDEAYGYLPPGEPSRSQTAAALGFLLGARHGAHGMQGVQGGSEQDRERGILLIEESLEFAGLPPVLGDVGRVMLGQLYVSRVLGSFQSQEFFAAAMQGGTPIGIKADLAGATGHLRTVVSTTRISEAGRAAQTLLTLTESLETLLGGFGSGIGGFDLSRMIEAITKIQEVQHSGIGVPLPGLQFPTVSPAEYAEQLAAVDPLDRPVVVADGPDSDSDPDSDEDSVPPVPPLVVDVDAMRRELRKMLSKDGDAQELITESVVSLLRSDDPPEWIDDFVSLAASIVSSASTSSDGTATGTDHLLLAAALYLRGRRDEGGWAEQDAEEDDDTAGGDAQAAVSSLLAAAETLPSEALESVPALVFLATLLPGDALEGVAKRLTELTAVLRAIGADAVVFPEPVRSLRLSVRTARIEPAIGDGLARIVVVGDGLFESGSFNDSADEPAVSYVRSLTQLRDLSRREVRPVTQEAVFVVNPRGDRETATMQAMLLRRSFYPRSTGLGHLIENTDGAGTVDEVRTKLDASLLHLFCGITTTGALELAGPAELELTGTAVSHGGLAILPPGHCQPLADILLDAGFTGVIGWTHPVPEPIAAVMLFVLHEALVDQGRTPAEAVVTVRRWLRNPDPESLPSLLAGSARQLGDELENALTAMVYRGR